MKLTRTATLTTALLLAGGLALTGCSSAGSPASGESSAGQESSASTGKLTQDNFAERISKAQFAAGSVHLTMEMGEASAELVEADLALDKDPKKMQMQMQMESGGMDAEIRLVDGTMFMNMGALSDNKFMDMSALGGGVGDITAMLDQMNPDAQLDSFGAALTEFAAEPDALEIDGVQTTKLTLTLDTRKMLEAAQQDGADIDTLVETLGETTVYEMFIGPDDLPRRIVSPNVAGVGTMTQDYTDWGKPVSVKAPTADEITDAPSFGG